MDPLRFLLTGILCLALVFHPRATIYCFKPRSQPSFTSRKRNPSSKRSLPSPLSSSASNRFNPTFSTKIKRTNSSKHKHKKHESGGPLILLSQSAHHNVISVLDRDDFAAGVVQKMFEKGWAQRRRAPPRVHEILKIHHTAESLQGFEAYRKMVKRRAEISGENGPLLFDGNEILRFWCSDFSSSISSFSTTPEEIVLSDSGLRAHEKLHGDWIRGRSVTRAMFVCRVIAGRVANRQIGGGLDVIEDGRFNSLMDGQDCLVMDSRAILPCFIVLYGGDNDHASDGGGDDASLWSTKLSTPTCSLSRYLRLITS